MILHDHERVLRREEATFPERQDALGTLTLTNQRVVFEVHERQGLRSSYAMTVQDILLENISSSRATDVPSGHRSIEPTLLHLETRTRPQIFGVRKAEEWVNAIADAKLSLPAPPTPATPTVVVNVNVPPSASPDHKHGPERVRCTYCSTLYDPQATRCPVCGAPTH